MFTLFISFMLYIYLITMKMPAGNAHSDWCYETEDCGPANWPGTCKTGKNQSPVDLKPEPNMTVTNWEVDFSRDFCFANIGFFIRNNGHTTELTRDRDQISSSISMRGEAFNDKSYFFSQFHFHWGSKDGQGSEHTIDGKSYPLELHLVFVLSKYNHILEAVANEDNDSLAVLGIFFDASDEHPDSPALEQIVGTFSCVNGTGGATVFGYRHKSLTLNQLLPSNREVFRYMGSLTTPSCGEKVLWTVFQTPVKISTRQLEVFRSMQAESHTGPHKRSIIEDRIGHPINAPKYGRVPLTNNYRPTQPYNGRIVKSARLVSTMSSHC